mmetsp:Transcript_115848/g.327789  ORF Transcript_115848/g.327789 Transcript_115848/m.327789 type:complete len:244 (+) Transcript_115848:758-1489(+)
MAVELEGDLDVSDRVVVCNRFDVLCGPHDKSHLNLVGRRRHAQRWLQLRRPDTFDHLNPHLQTAPVRTWLLVGEQGPELNGHDLPLILRRPLRRVPPVFQVDDSAANQVVSEGYLCGVQYSNLEAAVVRKLDVALFNSPELGRVGTWLYHIPHRHELVSSQLELDVRVRVARALAVDADGLHKVDPHADPRWQTHFSLEFFRQLLLVEGIVVEDRIEFERALKLAFVRFAISGLAISFVFLGL